MFCYPFSLSLWYNISMNYGYVYFVYYSKQFLLQNIGCGYKPVVALERQKEFLMISDFCFFASSCSFSLGAGRAEQSCEKHHNLFLINWCFLSTLLTL